MCRNKGSKLMPFSFKQFQLLGISLCSHNIFFVFTQSYGIYNAIQRRIENYTYIDYVDMRTPAFMAGMQRGKTTSGIIWKTR